MSGFDQGGLLTDGIDQHPHSVLLLDEIEKAHPRPDSTSCCRSWTTASWTDQQGKRIDFRNVVIIMTTNCGCRRSGQAGIGFGSSKRDTDDMEAINRLFSPEFRNRPRCDHPLRRPAGAGDPPGGGRSS